MFAECTNFQRTDDRRSRIASRDEIKYNVTQSAANEMEMIWLKSSHRNGHLIIRERGTLNKGSVGFQENGNVSHAVK